MTAGTSPRPPIIRLTLAALIGGLLAGITNMLVAALVNAVHGQRPLVQASPDGGVEQVSNATLVNASLVPAIIALSLFVVLRWNTHRPLRWFLLSGVVVLGLSFIPPATLDGTTTANTAWLMTMHVLTAVFIIGSIVLADRSLTAGHADGVAADPA